MKLDNTAISVKLFFKNVFKFTMAFLFFLGISFISLTCLFFFTKGKEYVAYESEQYDSFSFSAETVAAKVPARSIMLYFEESSTGKIRLPGYSHALLLNQGDYTPEYIEISETGVYIDIQPLSGDEEYGVELVAKSSVVSTYNELLAEGFLAPIQEIAPATPEGPISDEVTADSIIWNNLFSDLLLGLDTTKDFFWEVDTLQHNVPDPIDIDITKYNDTRFYTTMKANDTDIRLRFCDEGGFVMFATNCELSLVMAGETIPIEDKYLVLPYNCTYIIEGPLLIKYNYDNQGLDNLPTSHRIGAQWVHSYKTRNAYGNLTQYTSAQPTDFPIRRQNVSIEFDTEKEDSAGTSNLSYLSNSSSDVHSLSGYAKDTHIGAFSTTTTLQSWLTQNSSSVALTLLASILGATTVLYKTSAAQNPERKRRPFVYRAHVPFAKHPRHGSKR